MGDHFRSVTEIAGEEVASEQIARMTDRYQWAANIAAGRDVLEVACGTGQGLGMLAATARSVTAGDISPSIVAQARDHYGERVEVQVMDATHLPFDADSLDVVVLFEAIYYLSDVPAFLSEVRRVLRAGGDLLIATANPDLTDFNPSPYSHAYYGARELADLLVAAGYVPSLFGNTPIARVSARQRLLRPVKRVAVRLRVMPRSMRGKRMLKRLFFGDLVPMPAELTPGAVSPVLVPISAKAPDRAHKVLLCRATVADDNPPKKTASMPTLSERTRP